MNWNAFSAGALALLAAAGLLSPRVAVAGEHVRGGDVVSAARATPRSSPPQPTNAPVVRSAGFQVAVTVVPPAPTRPAKAPVYVNLRGPDGQTRRFLVEGGAAAIEAPQLVLRPGQSVTIRFAAR
jgi:hypothetical protein